MANAQNTQIGGFAGQLIASGIGPDMPLVALEQGVDATVFANLNAIQGMMPKIRDIFVRETRIFTNPLENYITKFDERYGAGLEQVAVKYGAYNEKQDGTCVPQGIPEMTSQLDLVNFAYSADIGIPDYLVDKVVLDDGQRGSVFSALMQAPLKVIASARYRAWVQLVSDVIDGTRSISSKDSFNGVAAAGAAASVTYNPTITGYAGLVEKNDAVLPPVEVGVGYTFPDAKAALEIANRIKSVAADFKFESTAFNKLGIETFVTSEPLLIAETKVLDAMDNVFAEANVNGNGSNFGYAGFPTVSAREYIRQFVGDIIEVDSFAALPTDPVDAVVTYAGYNLKFVLIDRDAFVEIIKNQSVEGQRCAKKRMTGYNWQGQMIFSIWRGVNSYALVAKSAGALSFSGTGVGATVGGESVTTGSAVAPGTEVTMTVASGTIASITVNGTTISGAKFNMPQGDAVVTVTKA